MSESCVLHCSLAIWPVFGCHYQVAMVVLRDFYQHVLFCGFIQKVFCCYRLVLANSSAYNCNVGNFDVVPASKFQLLSYKVHHNG